MKKNKTKQLKKMKKCAFTILLNAMTKQQKKRIGAATKTKKWQLTFVIRKQNQESA